MRKLNLNAIRIDGETQARVSLSESTVAEYAECLEALPPVVVFFDGSDNWLADGFHRFHAYRKAGKASIPADIRTGTQRDAILYSYGANRAHGLRMTNADKRKAVGGMLADAEWNQWSDRKIADACGVSHTFVALMRKPPEVATVATQAPEASGNVATQKPAKVVAVTTPTAPAQHSESLKSSAPETPAAGHFGPSAEEIAEAERAQQEELEALRRIADADDKLSTALAEVKRLTALNAVLQSRVDGLMAEKNEAIRAAKSWQRKFEKAERATREAA